MWAAARAHAREAVRTDPTPSVIAGAVGVMLSTLLRRRSGTGTS
jgi:hypothetical protein